jgi:repressor LexA
MDRTEKKDLDGFRFIRNQVIHTGVTPSLREIARAVGYKSPRSIQLMLERLQKLGLLIYSEGTIRLRGKTSLLTEQTVDVPLVGSVACGTPTLAEQEPEMLIRISTKIAKPGHRYFLLRAVGNSMNRSGIRNGDLVLVRQQPVASEGDRVVALINDDATIKHFRHAGDMVALTPNSTEKKHQPIILSDDFTIQGVVAAVLPATLY